MTVTRRVRTPECGHAALFKIVASVIVLTVLRCPALAAAPDPSTDLPTLWAADKAVGGSAAKSNPTPEWGAQKSYLIPALEILGFDVLVNQFGRHYYGCCDYHSTMSSIRQNLRGPWVVDSDGFTVNQLGHPYQGSMYHGFARASGLGFAESMGYTFAGSILWEIAGETTPPSKNDQIMTGIGGSFLGEPLFRMANLILENAEGPPRFWREAAAAVVSPPTGFNRLAFGDRFAGIFDSHKPDYYSRFQAGGSSTTQNTPGASSSVKSNEALLDFSMDYGLPGKPGYTYTRPFDYFNFQAIASSANGLESVNTRGLLIGKDYEAGPNYRGVWGVYGSYDYLAPQLFRVSSTALSVGTTGQWGANSPVKLQGTALLGAGYTAVGTIHDAANTNDNHYGVSPQALVALRLIFGERASLDVTGREYFVSRLGAGTAGGHDNIVRGDASFTIRIHKQHAIAIKYLITRRDATTTTLGDQTQTRGTVGIFYTLLGQDRFAGVNWLE
jgi:hypothetical protein